MREHYDWSASFGRWLGVPFRIHVLLALFVLTIFAFDWHFSHLNQGVSTGFVTSLVLLVSLLAHELAHVVAAVNLGAQVHWIALAPWGGYTSLTLPPSNRAKLTIHCAGLLASLVLFMFAAALLVQAGQARLEELINPFRPRRFQIENWPSSLLTIFAWINAQLVLINLIPCYPFDGGRILRVLFASVNRELSRVKIESTLMAIGQLTGAILIGMALLLHQNNGVLDPPWAYLVGLGIVLIFAARHEYRRQLRAIQVEEGWDDEAHANSWDEHLAFDDSEFSFTVDDGYSQWLTEKQWQREAQQQQQQLLEDEVDDELRVDQILRKVHAQGISSLDEEERRLLERFSARVRRQREIDSA